MSTTKKTTLEDASAPITELAKFQKETDHRLKEVSIELKKTQKETDRRFNSQWGKLAESLVEGDIAKKFSERGIEVQGTSQRAKRLFNGKEYEFDIIAQNDDEIIAIEVKITLDVKKVDHFIEKLTDFKDILPEYRNKKIYGAVAYIVADGSSDKYSQNQKLFAIRATGNSSVIINPKDFKPRNF